MYLMKVMSYGYMLVFDSIGKYTWKDICKGF